MARVIYQYADFGGEKSSVAFPINSLANEGALRTAVEAVTLGQLQKVTSIDSDSVISAANAASQWAQVELGLRLHVADSVNGESGYITIPCPDLGTLTVDQDSVDLTDAGVMAALVTQVETNVLSRDGNALTVTRAEIVGRNR